MKRSTVSTAIVGSSWGSTMWRNDWVGVAPSTRAASSRLPGIAWMRAVRKRKAKGNDRQASNITTLNSAVLTCRSMPKIDRFSEELRNAIGSLHAEQRGQVVVGDPELRVEHRGPHERRRDHGGDVRDEHARPDQTAAAERLAQGERGQQAEPDRARRPGHGVDERGDQRVDEAGRGQHVGEVLQAVVAEEARQCAG